MSTIVLLNPVAMEERVLMALTSTLAPVLLATLESTAVLASILSCQLNMPLEDKSQRCCFIEKALVLIQLYGATL